MESKKHHPLSPAVHEAFAAVREQRAEEHAQLKGIFDSDAWKKIAQRIAESRDRSRSDLERLGDTLSLYRAQGELSAFNATLELPARMLKETAPYR
jgi:hypothetical protein